MPSDSVLDIIAKMTAKTIASVREVYHETSTGDKRTQTEPSEKDSSKDSAIPFFSYGTPFSNIVEFTREVEEFTRHIDTQTRKLTEGK